MNVTHHLSIQHWDYDIIHFECLCTRECGITMIFAMLRSRKEERFMIHLREMMTGKEEEIACLLRDGACYYYTDKVDLTGITV